MFYCFNFSACTRFFVEVLIETNVNISNEHEVNISEFYRSVKYIGSLAKFTRTPPGFIHFARDPK